MDGRVGQRDGVDGSVMGHGVGRGGGQCDATHTHVDDVQFPVAGCRYQQGGGDAVDRIECGDVGPTTTTTSPSPSTIIVVTGIHTLILATGMQVVIHPLEIVPAALSLALGARCGGGGRGATGGRGGGGVIGVQPQHILAALQTDRCI